MHYTYLRANKLKKKLQNRKMYLSMKIMNAMPLWRERTHTHTLSATTNSLGLKKFSSLSASHKIDRRTAPHPTGWPISCHAIGLSS